MARTMRRDRQRKRRRLSRIKVCRMCEHGINFIDFKDVDTLRRYQTEEGKILPRRITGNCYVHQKMLRRAIKKARNLAMVK